MKESELLFGMKGVALLAALLVWGIFRMIVRSGNTREAFLGAYREFAGMVKNRGANSSLYCRLDRWLVRNGAPFHYGKWMNPAGMLLVSFLLGLFGGAVCLRLGILQGILGCLVMAAAPSAMLVYLNAQDTVKQLPELKLVYHALEIQIKAGMFITDALAECYSSVQEPRLKTALLDLAGDIVMKADVFESLNKFQGKFDNRYVDSLCITILQALESGQAVELLRDIGEQIKDMEESVLEKKKASLDRMVTFCELGVLTIVPGLALYACRGYMMGAAVNV